MMHYKMTTPCDACPYLKGNGFTLKALLAHARGEFPCHKQCVLDEEKNFVPASEKTAHCAGALIFLELREAPHQMMRICERIGLYDHTKLDMAAPVAYRAEDFPRQRGGNKS